MNKIEFVCRTLNAPWQTKVYRNTHTHKTRQMKEKGMHVKGNCETVTDLEMMN